MRASEFLPCSFPCVSTDEDSQNKQDPHLFSKLLEQTKSHGRQLGVLGDAANAVIAAKREQAALGSAGKKVSLVSLRFFDFCRLFSEFDDNLMNRWPLNWPSLFLVLVRRLPFVSSYFHPRTATMPPRKPVRYSLSCFSRFLMYLFHFVGCRWEYSEHCH